MVLEKKPERKSKPNALTVRLSNEGDRKLRIMTTVLNLTQANVIESLLAHEYEKVKHKYLHEVKKAERDFKGK